MDTVFAVSFAPDLPAHQRETLLVALRSSAQVQETQPKQIDWPTVLVVFKQAVEVADSVTKLAAFATLIYGWAQALRSAGQPPQARLERPGQPALDLATASEQELLAWLLKRPPT